MDSLYRNLKSVEWWFSVVIVGLVISIIGSYIRSFLDTRVPRTASWFRSRTKASEKKFSDLVDTMANNPTAQMHAFFAEQRAHTTVIIVLLFGVLSLVLLFPQVYETKEENHINVITLKVIFLLIAIVVEVCLVRASYLKSVLRAVKETDREKSHKTEAEHSLPQSVSEQ
jgi:H+/gluconate symporter-like permease